METQVPQVWTSRPVQCILDRYAGTGTGRNTQMFKLTYDVVTENEAEFEAMLGDVYTLGGVVNVRSDGTQVGEVCTVIVRGELAAVAAWMDERALDGDSLLAELATAITDRMLL